MSPSAGPVARRRAGFALLVASGCAGLGYQIVWTQQSALWLGHEAAAVLAVVAAFFGGLGLGALVLGPRIARTQVPGRWYAACEAATGLWSLALTGGAPRAGRLLLDAIGPQPSFSWHWSVAFGGTLLLLLPATAAMGATLPAMERAVAGLRREGASIGTLYAGNTVGAVLGVLGAAFWLVPAVGLARTAAVCAALNFACAAVAWRYLGARGDRAAPRVLANAAAVLTPLAITGLLGIGYEVLVVRVVSQVTENTVYTFAILLAVYLIGTALGAAGYARWLAVRQRARLRDRLLLALAFACVLGVLTLGRAEALRAALLDAFGASMPAALAAEIALAAAAFLPATIAMGALFSELATAAQAAGVSFARALGVNTLGAAAAPAAFGVLLVSGPGAKLAMLGVAAGYLALASRRAWTGPAQWTAASAAVAAALSAPSLAIIDVPDGGRIASYAEGAIATVSVVEDARGVATLHIDNRQQEGSSATRLADARQGVLPVLLHPAPSSVLFLGLGTGVTAAAAAADPSLRVDAVELLPEVVAASAYFVRAAPGQRPRVLTADARRFVRTAPGRYDVIVADNFHPARSGSGSLYTVEHFAAVRDRLADGGLFCQWLPLHQLDLDTLRSIVRTFLAVYPRAAAVLATNSLDTPTLGLVARNGSDRLDPAELRTRLAAAAAPLATAELGIADELALLGAFVAGPRALASFAAHAPLNTDDLPVVAYWAPRITYAPDSRPRDRLLALLRELEIEPDELLAAGAATAYRARLAAYWTARDRFLEAGRDVRLTTDVRTMLAQVRGPLFAVLAISPEFRPAYDPLLQMAVALESVDAAAASDLLTELATAQPARPEAVEVLRGLTEARGEPSARSLP